MADWNDKIHDTVDSAEAELKRLIQYMNDEVVPSIRKEGGEALKAASEQLRIIIEKLERKR